MRIRCTTFFWGEGSRAYLWQWGTTGSPAGWDSISTEQPPKSHLHYASCSWMHATKPTLFLWSRGLLEEMVNSIIVCSASQQVFDKTPNEGYVEANNWPQDKGESPLPINIWVSNGKREDPRVWYYLQWNISTEGWHGEVWISGAYEI